jgi:hypothetical protein
MRLLYIGLSTSLYMYAQLTGHVTGRVTSDREDQRLRADLTAVAGDTAIRMDTMTTDGQGEFRWDLRVGVVTIIVRADGYVSEQRQLLVRPGTANQELRFALAPAGVVSGHVLDPNGAAVAGAKVWLQYRGESRAWRLGEEAGGEETDAFGSFTVPVVAQGRPFVLHAHSEQWLLSTSGTIVLRGPKLSGVALLLSRRGALVSGRIFNSSGQPVSGMTVHLRALPEENEFSAEQRESLAFPLSLHKTALSQRDGTYTFSGVPNGRVVLTTGAHGRQGVSESNVAAGSRTSINLILR